MLKKSFLFALITWGFLFLIFQNPVLASGKKLILGDKTLDITTLPNIQAKYVLEAGDITQTTHYNLDPVNCELFSFDKGFSYIKIKRMAVTGKSEEPLIPMKVIKVELPQHTKICGVRILSGKFREIKNVLHIVPMPEQKEWRFDNGGIKHLSHKTGVYESEDYYPGNWISCDGGSNGRQTIVFVRIFPLQYIPSIRQGVLLTEATIEISYRMEINESNLQGFPPTQSESFIIYPQSFQAAAERLKSIHDSLGVSTEIYTTEAIDTTYFPAGKSSFTGYASHKPYQLHTYNYELARKITNFLCDSEQHPELQYITLLGSGQQVPPSYYFGDATCYYDYDYHAASDFLYASPDDDIVPNYQVGRLPGRNPEEIQGVVDKIRRWCAQTDFSWFNNVAVAGGQMFRSEFYVGELVIQDAINRNYFQGAQITKFFRTDNNFNKNAVNPILQNGNFGFLYQMGHGSGDALYFDDHTYISCVDLFNFTEDIDRLPIIVSVACANAAFDTDIVGIPGGAAWSFGEAVLLSKAGGIAYLGGSRSSGGTPVFYFDKGNLVIEKEPRMAGMLTFAFQKYHECANHLGQLYAGAIEKFIEDNQMSDDHNQRTMFKYTLLGDPVLVIPVQDTNTTTLEQPKIVAESYDYLNESGIPTFINVENKSYNLRAETNSPYVTFKHIKFKKTSTFYVDGEVLESNLVDAAPPFEYQGAGKNGYNYLLLRATTEDEKEGWLYCYTTDFNLAIDGKRTDWEAAGLEPVAVDTIGNVTPVQWDLHRLYVTDDSLNWYFGFDADFSNADLTIGLAIDTRPGGYSGIQGQDVDAFRNYITFPENNGVDYEIYFRGNSINSTVTARFREFSWGGNYYDYLSKMCFAAHNGNSQFVEVLVPKEDFKNVNQMDIILFSTLLDGPAIDSVPSDSATYTELHTGSAYANTLSNFVTVFSNFNTSSVLKTEKNLPLDYVLFQNYPNPFNASTLIKFQLPVSSEVSLKIYNAMGQEIVALISDEKKPAGSCEILWNAARLSSGIYFYRLQAGKYVETRKLLLLK